MCQKSMRVFEMGEEDTHTHIPTYRGREIEKSKVWRLTGTSKENPSTRRYVYNV